VHVIATDALTQIAGGEYSVDSSEDWFDLAADDDIFDSMSEAATFTINDLEPGEHRIAVRVSDRHFNTTYVAQTVTVGDRRRSGFGVQEGAAAELARARSEGALRRRAAGARTLLALAGRGMNGGSTAFRAIMSSLLCEAGDG